MRRWFRDTLFLRLFLLMWAALVVSHFAAFSVVTSTFLLPGLAPSVPSGYPTFPSLPPTLGMPGGPFSGSASPDRGRPPPPPMAAGEIRTEPLPGERPTGAPPSGGPPSGNPPNGDRPNDNPADGGRPSSRGPGGFPSLPMGLLALDYAIRLVVIGVAAAIGARWLSKPVQRLVDAAGSLGRSVRDQAPLPTLDEHGGTAEVRDAARVFNRMARELHAQFRSRSLLMASLSHDLKTPLTRMRMRLENEAEAVFVQRCIGDIREMSGLLDTALDVFRDASADEPTQTVDVQALLQSIVDDLAEQGRPALLRDASSASLVRAQPVALRRIVTNLVGNALRYAGGVEIGIDSDGRTMRIVFDDRGPGIAAQHLESVFEPFFRVETSRNRESGGTGLGLYIARDFARRQGGELILSNRVGGGLRAELQLPATAAPDNATQRA